MKKTIAWEKYKNPFEEMKDAQLETSEEETDYNDGYDELEEGQNQVPNMFMPIPMSQMSMMDPFREFNLWTGHTNFVLNEAAVMQIQAVTGVETLNPISPYRMRLGIAKLFKPRDVFSAIHKQLSITFNPSGESV